MLAVTVLSLNKCIWDHLRPLPLACATSSKDLVAYVLTIIQVPIDAAAKNGGYRIDLSTKVETTMQILNAYISLLTFVTQHEKIIGLTCTDFDNLF